VRIYLYKKLFKSLVTFLDFHIHLFREMYVFNYNETIILSILMSKTVKHFPAGWKDLSFIHASNYFNIYIPYIYIFWYKDRKKNLNKEIILIWK